ncbi:MAG: S8 family serine peptidase [Bacteroidota bacterium]
MQHEAVDSGTITDSIVSIGYQPEGFQNLNEHIHEIDFNQGEWKAVRLALLDYIEKEHNRLHPDKPVKGEDLLVFGEKPLPYINVPLYDYELIASLRNMNVVRYLEPMGYGTENDPSIRSGAGCGGGSSAPSSDYTTVSPNAKVSWNYQYMNIQNAWNLSQGDNIVVGLIDSGISSNQNKLNSGFASGQSSGRFRQKYGFFETCSWWFWCSNDGPNDDCGHGTSMAGVIAAPRTNAGSSVGVAYKADLVSCRGTDDVVINSSNEKDGVSDSYYFLGGRSDVKIISMSLGDVFYSGQVADAVRYANNQGKLIFAAAGTSLTWTSWVGVIFPASMNETVAVTGTKTGTPIKRCSVCHDGSKVDFTVTMEDRNNSDRVPITLAMSGNSPVRVGGSSVATATTAGIAALVWGANPSQSKSQVLNRMIQAGSNYPNRNGSFGWGEIDAYAAVNSVP